MAVSNFLMTAAAIAAVATLMSKDIRKTTTTLRQNVKQIRGWMEEAGAEIVERTSEDGVMGAGGLLKIAEMKRTIDRIDAWAGRQAVGLHVPVDSPSANFPICKRLRRRGKDHTVPLLD